VWIVAALAACSRRPVAATKWSWASARVGAGTKARALLGPAGARGPRPPLLKRSPWPYVHLIRRGVWGGRLGPPSLASGLAESWLRTQRYSHFATIAGFIPGQASEASALIDRQSAPVVAVISYEAH
jgi:hypothetical protein